MLSLSKSVLSAPTVSYQDKLMYMTSLGLYHSIGDKNSNNQMLMEQIYNLISSKSTEYMGLQLLVLAFQQNPDTICVAANWPNLLYPIIKNPAGTLVKNLACKILSMILPSMTEDPKYEVFKEEFIKDIFPHLLLKIDQNVEWAEEASLCVKTSLKCFPREFANSKNMLLSTILGQVNSCISSKSFEVLAECFCYLPYCSRDINPDNVQQRWVELYMRTLKTIESLQSSCLTRENFARQNIDPSEFMFSSDGENETDLFYIRFLKRVRRYVNLCKCLAKLISVESKYFARVPVMSTLNCLIPLYQYCKKERFSPDEEVLYTFLPQMRLASLVIVEAIILNCNVFKVARILKDFLTLVIRSSANTVSEKVSELRSATWKLVNLWLDGFGSNAAEKIANTELTDEIMKDINIDASESHQANDAAQTQKSKKNLATSRKSMLKRKNLPRVCEAALNSLESLLYIGSPYIPKKAFQGIHKTIFEICDTIPSSNDFFPFPYNDESCRERLYSVVLAIAVVAKPDEFHILEAARNILNKINNDPSFKVRKISNKIPVMSKLLCYPRRPLPAYSVNKQRQANVLNQVQRQTNISQVDNWSSARMEDNLEIEPEAEAVENVNIKEEPSSENENEIQNEEEYMEVEPQYHEEVNENQCNGEDILEIQSSSQCQDDSDSDEEEEEEEEEERSFDDEEMNQEEHLQEMYIPSSSKSPLPIQINAVETVQSASEPEYEECTPSIKVEENAVNSNNKENCINGEDDVIQEEEVPSSSAQTANENGIFGADDDDLDEENEEEEDEENEKFQAEKKEESQDPPMKRQKIQAEESDNVDEREDDGARSPTLDEMKADFLKVIPPSSVEEVKTEKTQMSVSS